MDEGMDIHNYLSRVILDKNEDKERNLMFK
jgi:hypothetical protein